jgi:hypothetical protein
MPRPHATARFVQGLAVLGGHGARKLFEVLFEQGLEFVKHLRAGIDRRVSPRRKRAGCRLHRCVNIGCRRERCASDDVANRRIVDVEEIGGVGFQPAAADEIVEGEDVRA